MNPTPSLSWLATCTLAGLSGSASAQSEFDAYSSGLAQLGYVNELEDVSDDGRTLLGQAVTMGSTYLIEEGSVMFLLPGAYSGTVGAVLSGDGRVVAGRAQPSSRAITWTDFGDPVELALPPGTIGSVATAINADGSVVVGYALSGPAPHVAVRWIQGAPIVVPVPGGATEVVFTDVSPDGSRMVGNLAFSSGSPTSRAVRWSESAGYADLELPAGASRSAACAQSADGSWVVGSFFSPSLPGDRAVLWDATGAATVLHDPAWSDSQAVGIDHAGTRVLLRSNGGFFGRAHLYDLATGIRTPFVDVLAQTGGPSIPFDDLLGPLALSGDGSTAVGNFYADSAGDEFLWGARINSFGTKVCGTANSSSSGLGASLLGSGSLSIGDNSAVLTATLMPPGEFGLFLASRTLETSSPMGSSGILCLGGDIGRFNGAGQFGMSSAAGTLSLSLDLGSLPQPAGAVSALPGESWSFQVWFRDQDPQPTSNFSDALSAMLVQ